MTVSRALLALPGAFFLALVGLALMNGSAENTPPAHAGPCARDPYLFFDTDDPEEDDPLEDFRLFGSAGKSFSGGYLVDTNPNVPPLGKPSPYTSISIEGTPGHAGIHPAFTPEEAEQQFETTLVITIDPGVPAGAYDFEITITCHTDADTIEFTLYVDTCPTPASVPQGATPTPEPFPDECAEESPTPTAAASPTPTSSPSTVPSETPVPTPTVTPSPGPGNLWGDSDCDGSVTTRDNQALLRNVLTQAPLSQQIPCPLVGAILRFLNGFPNALPAGELPTGIWGDSDCDGSVSSRDNQALLRTVLGQNALSQTEPCPDLGSEVTVEVVDG